MTKLYTNREKLSLSIAVFLADDLYDHSDDPNEISVTSLIKPIKQIILAQRVPESGELPDVSSVVKAQTGTAVHTAVEESWTKRYVKAMQALGYPQKVIDMVRVNPTQEEVLKAREAGIKIAPVYFEKRTRKKVEGMTVSGQFDMVMDGVLEDIKNTSTFTYINKSNDEAYKLQGSIYRWLNPEIITSDFIRIQYFFSDWSAAGLKQYGDKYPPRNQMAYEVPLMSLEETDDYVRQRVLQYKELVDAAESKMPQCTEEQLWKTPDLWKFYSKPTNKKPTKNFTEPGAAYALFEAKGSMGKVVHIPGEVKACRYCGAFPVCKQKDAYFLK